MTLAERIKEISITALKELYPEADISLQMVNINQTKPEFTGDYTIVLFPFVKLLRRSLMNWADNWAISSKTLLVLFL